MHIDIIMFKKIKKLWNTGQYSSKRELVEAFCKEHNVDLNTTNKYELETIWVINRIAENITQGGDGHYWK